MHHGCFEHSFEDISGEDTVSAQSVAACIQDQKSEADNS
jgi:hypothetical protein